MSALKRLTTKKPVKLIFTGGFLGSGKTTALAALAKSLIQRGKRVGIITNDQSENLVDTVIVRQMLADLNVPVEEVVEGCFCCKFEELVNQMEKILSHDPDILMGEPVGSCTDFVAAVANPIKIHYHESLHFAPFSIMVDPDRVRELLLGETQTGFPEEVAYLFKKQMEEADIIVLNKIDLLGKRESDRLLITIKEKFTEKAVTAVSARSGDGMDDWLKFLLSGKPAANSVLRQIDYDRYAAAEAVLGWLNAAVRITSREGFDVEKFVYELAISLREAFAQLNAEVGHLKFVFTSAGKSMWMNLTRLSAEPSSGGAKLESLSRGTLIINARVRLEPDTLEKIVRDALRSVSESATLQAEILDLQCFSPAYPAPPYLVRESIS